MDGTSVAHMLFFLLCLLVILDHFLYNFHNSTSLNYSCTPPSYPTLLFIIIYTYASFFLLFVELPPGCRYAVRSVLLLLYFLFLSFCCHFWDLMRYIFYWTTGCSYLNIRNFLPWPSPYRVNDQFPASLTLTQIWNAFWVHVTTDRDLMDVCKILEYQVCPQHNAWKTECLTKCEPT